ncbi:MAG: NAD(P)/FAD-dependent oxidoreductase [Saprospiraceae bacterium]
MKNLVILGAGSAGTIMANNMVKKLNSHEWHITIVDQETQHYYQPGFLFLPFGIYSEKDVLKPIEKLIPAKVSLIQSGIDRINGAENQVFLENGAVLFYDILIVATGTRPAPEEVPGMKGEGWYKDVFDFYTFEGAKALHDKLATWEGGKLVVHITELPIKCPVAPLEFAFLADDFFTKKGMRDKVKITYVTPMSGAFTKPRASQKLTYLLEEKGIDIVSDFYIESVDNEAKKIIDYGGAEVAYDLLVTVPLNKGSEVIARSGLGDELNYIATDKNTLQTEAFDNIFAIGDATNLPASKAGSVAHFEAEVLTENILRYIKGEPLKAEFDGHANCFIETGHGKALLIDFNYDQEPVEGTFPLPGIGPLQLLKESPLNHWGKLAFRWIYWNVLMKGLPIPFVHPQMSKSGKLINAEAVEETE